MSESTTVLQARLDTLRAAYWDLVAGTKATVLGYDMGTGKRSVTYTPANLDVLRAAIARLEAQLGVPHCERTFRRRAIGFRFHGG